MKNDGNELRRYGWCCAGCGRGLGLCLGVRENRCRECRALARDAVWRRVPSDAAATVGGFHPGGALRAARTDGVVVPLGSGETRQRSR